jgi:tRNA(fMet)-specific endonuclease VapC
MLYVLDTDTVIDVLRHRPLSRAAFEAHSPDDLAICSMTVAELYYGAAGAPDPARERRKIDLLLSPLAVLPFDTDAAERHAAFRRALRATPIGERDLVIASTVPPGEATLITRNQREFLRIPGLLVNTWGS